jgi:hypothetical protein
MSDQPHEPVPKSPINVRGNAWMRHHNANFVTFFVLCWGTWAIVSFACAVALIEHHGPGSLVGGVVFAALGFFCAGYAFRVLSTRMMVTDTEVVVQNIRRTVRVPRDQVRRFETRTSYILPRASSASIALTRNDGPPIKLVAFEKFPDSDSWWSYSRGNTYWDDTVGSLNALIGYTEEPEVPRKRLRVSDAREAVRGLPSLAALLLAGRLLKRRR